MPIITEATVKFGRKIQVRDYEPAESEVTLKATLLEGEDPKEAIAFLQDFVSGEVHDVLGLPRATKLPVRASRATGEQVTRRENTVGSEKKTVGVDIPASGSTKPAGEPKTDDLGIPAETNKVAAGAATASPGAGLDIPASETPTPTPAKAGKESKSAKAETPKQQVASEVAPASLSPAELSKWIGEKVRDGKVSPEAVKGLYPQFKVTRFADLKPDQTAAVQAAVEKLIKGSTNDGQSAVVMA